MLKLSNLYITASPLLLVFKLLFILFIIYFLKNKCFLCKSATCMNGKTTAGFVLKQLVMPGNVIGETYQNKISDEQLGSFRIKV